MVSVTTDRWRDRSVRRDRQDGRRIRRGTSAMLLAIGLMAAGCGDAQPTSPGPAALGSAALPSTIAASQAPAPAPSQRPEVAAIGAFVKLVTKDNFSYQATFKGRSRHSADRLPVKGSLAVSGRNYRVTAAFTFRDGTGRVEHRLVGGKGYVRFDSQPWRALKGFGQADSMSPFAEVRGVESVTFIGTEQVGGRTLYRIQIVSVPLHPSLIPAGNLTKEVVTSGFLKLLIDGAGRPVSGTATINGNGRVSGQLQEIIIELNLTFAKVGQKVTISKP
jgi:hypothetical protein